MPVVEEVRRRQAGDDVVGVRDTEQWDVSIEEAVEVLGPGGIPNPRGPEVVLQLHRETCRLEVILADGSHARAEGFTGEHDAAELRTRHATQRAEGLDDLGVDVLPHAVESGVHPAALALRERQGELHEFGIRHAVLPVVRPAHHDGAAELVRPVRRRDVENWARSDALVVVRREPSRTDALPGLPGTLLAARVPSAAEVARAADFAARLVAVLTNVDDGRRRPVDGGRDACVKRPPGADPLALERVGDHTVAATRIPDAAPSAVAAHLATIAPTVLTTVLQLLRVADRHRVLDLPPHSGHEDERGVRTAELLVVDVAVRGRDELEARLAARRARPVSDVLLWATLGRLRQRSERLGHGNAVQGSGELEGLLLCGDIGLGVAGPMSAQKAEAVRHHLLRADAEPRLQSEVRMLTARAPDHVPEVRPLPFAAHQRARHRRRKRRVGGSEGRCEGRGGSSGRRCGEGKSRRRSSRRVGSGNKRLAQWRRRRRRHLQHGRNLGAEACGGSRRSHSGLHGGAKRRRVLRGGGPQPRRSCGRGRPAPQHRNAERAEDQQRDPEGCPQRDRTLGQPLPGAPP
mmetsp:Transcript_46000/g.127738  ORF Transcript_46000/g.127738 Transcript_46000/m.127738 type:complete len:576 (+) Transcript_46000:416-2143(+)